MTITVEQQETAFGWLTDKLPIHANNPSAIQQLVYQYIDKASSGEITLVDISNPFSLALEMGCVLSANAINEDRAETRKMYAALSQTEQELFNHAATESYSLLFAQPLTEVFSGLIKISSLNPRMVYDSLLQCYKAIIPRNTEIAITGITFSLQYPIVIKRLMNGAYVVSYDATISSPLQTLRTNIIPSEVRTDSTGEDWLYFDFDATQFKITSQTYPISSTTGFTATLALTDSFHYCRVYNRPKNATIWKEIATTQSVLVYDTNTPTCLIRVADGNVYFTLPQIYTNTSAISGDMRVDVYETKGAISLMMASHPPEAFSFDLRTIDTNDKTAAVTALYSVEMILFTTRDLIGGTGEPTFSEKRNIIIDQEAGASVLPINNKKLTGAEAAKNYVLVPSTDTLTNRAYLATREIIAPQSTVSTSVACAGIGTINYSLADLVDSSSNYMIQDNDTMSRVVLLPNNLYVRESGSMRVLSTLERQQIMALDVETRTALVNTGSYFYTPFYYVLDDRHKTFNLRPYHLDNPIVKSFRFKEQKETSAYITNTQAYRIEKVATGYMLYITTKSNDAYLALTDDKVFAQLSYTVPVINAKASLLGTLVTAEVSGERTFAFHIETDHDIDENHYLKLKNLAVLNNVNAGADAELLTVFDIVYGVYSTNIVGTISADEILADNILEETPNAITHELIGVQFGVFLDNLWSRAQSVINADSYQRYTSNVPMLYTEDVYETGEAVTVSGGVVTVNAILHHTGDIVSDSNGVVYKHVIGDVVLDVNGNPVLNPTYELQRSMDIFFLEGVYYFTNDELDVSYIKTAVNTLVEWVTSDMDTITDVLIENSVVFFYPRKNIGTVQAIADGNKTVSINADQRLVVNLYVTDSVQKDTTLRDALDKAIIVALAKQLKSSTTTISGLVDAVRGVVGNSAIEISVQNLGDGYKTLTLTDQGAGLSIAKKLTRLPGNTLSIRDDVTINYIVHVKS